MATMQIAAEAFDEIAAEERISGVQSEVVGVPGYLRESQEACIVAQMVSAGEGAGTALPGVPYVISGDGSQAAVLGGRGSQAHRMTKAFRAGNKTTPLSVIFLADDAAGVAATKTVTIGGAATAAGTLPFYVGLDRIRVGVAEDDAAADVATALIAAINAAADLMVTAEATATPAEVKVTAKHKGECGNEVKLHVALLGELGGEAVPAGLTVSGLGFLTAGATNPEQAAARAAVANREYFYFLLGWSDTATLDAWSAEIEDMWTPTRDLWGRIAFTGRRGSLSQLKSFGAARNDRFISSVGTYETPSPAFETAARAFARVVRSLANHPARPLHTLTLVGDRAAPPESRFSKADRKDLLWSGLATIEATPAGGLQIDRMITMWQRNSAGDADDTWLDVTTPATVGRIVNEIKKLVHDRFIATRCILVDDGTPVGPGIPYTTPKLIEATVIAHYDRLQSLGLAENIEAFKALFKVGRDPSNPTRVNMIYTPDIANPLITFANRVEFSLQWPQELLAAA
ncbi:MAG: phage tail sheath subtilisin-like domain-containing protein [Rhodospirillales bacterium]|nr:phage tail sheath subtilisin-like domain-containing protein [Rhodospirillales bacterium]